MIQIERKKASETNWVIISVDATSPYFDTVELGQNYEYRAKQTINGVSSAYTVIHSITSETDTIAPSIPLNLVEDSKTTTSISVSCDVSIDAETEIRGYIFNINDVDQVEVNSPFFTSTDLTPSTSYTFKVKSVDIYNNVSAYSSELIITTVAENILSPSSFEIVNFASTTFPLDQSKTNYLAYKPEGYDEASDKSFSVLINLHGLDEYFDDYGIAGITRLGTGKLISEGFDLSSIDADGMVHIVPQQPFGTYWEHTGASDSWNRDYLNEIYQIVKTYKVDPDKVYIAGLSMGGKGALQYANEYPEKIAGVLAIAPNVGVGNASVFADNHNLWLVHGENDTTFGGFGFATTETFYNEILALNPTYDIKFSKPLDVGHNTWDKTYNNTADDWTLVADGIDPIGGVNSVYTWLKSKEKQSPANIVSSVLHGQIGVALNQAISFVSDEPLTALDSTVLTNANIGNYITYKNSLNVNKEFAATISADKMTITVTPSVDLSSDETYTIILNIAGNKLHDSTFELSFESESSTYVIEDRALASFSNQYQTAPTSWTSINGAQTIGTTYPLKTFDTNIENGWGLEITDAFQGGNNGQGSDSNLTGYPNAQVESTWTFETTAGFKLTGLIQGKYYKIRIFGNRNVADYVTTYTISTESIPVVVGNNRSVVAEFLDKQADQNGEISIALEETIGGYEGGAINIIEVVQSNLPQPN